MIESCNPRVGALVGDERRRRRGQAARKFQFEGGMGMPCPVNPVSGGT